MSRLRTDTRLPDASEDFAAMKPTPHLGANQHGASLLELLVAAAVFALMVGAVDRVFVTAHRTTQQAELGAEVGQNARIAIERLTREIREANRDNIVLEPVTSPDVPRAVAFRSARPNDTDPIPVFCLDVPGASDRLYHASCSYFDAFQGTYAPVWQRIVGYHLLPATERNACGAYNLHRYIIDQTDVGVPGLPSNPASPGAVDREAIIASCIEDLRVFITGSPGKSRLSIAVLLARGERQVQGSSVPPQQIRLIGEAWIRNDQE